jgi:hypothetical protein
MTRKSFRPLAVLLALASTFVIAPLSAAIAQENTFASEITEADVQAAAEALALDIWAAIDNLPEDATVDEVKEAIEAVLETSGASVPVQSAALAIVAAEAEASSNDKVVEALSRVSVFISEDDTTGGVPGDGDGLDTGGSTTGGTLPVGPPPAGVSGGGSDY